MAAIAATVVFATNPNLLYLQSTAMNEPVFMAALMATSCTSRSASATRNRGWPWAALGWPRCAAR
jgi:hypothetical protein